MTELHNNRSKLPIPRLAQERPSCLTDAWGKGWTLLSLVGPQGFEPRTKGL
jgi:hypothetical protein